jgi:hypothetical protein
MNHVVATEYRSKLCTAQRLHNWYMSSMATKKSCDFIGAAILRLNHQASAACDQNLARLLKAAHRLPGATGKTEKFTDPSHKRSLQNGEEIGGHMHRATRCFRKHAPLGSGL